MDWLTGVLALIGTIAVFYFGTHAIFMFWDYLDRKDDEKWKNKKQ